jgi:hypothetical protein
MWISQRLLIRAATKKSFLFIYVVFLIWKQSDLPTDSSEEADDSIEPKIISVVDKASKA